METLFASHNEKVYRLTVGSVDDIADAIRGEYLETIPAGPFDFWLTPSLHPGHRKLNHAATKILLGASTFTGRSVPLMRGRVVVTARDQWGHLRSLTDEEITWLADFVYGLPHLADWVVERRLERAGRRDRRRSRAERATANRRQLHGLPPK